MFDVYCPKCENEFEWPIWQNGNCPNCGAEFIFDEMLTDYDSYVIVEFLP